MPLDAGVDAGPPEPCGKMSLLADTFDAEQPDVWSHSYASGGTTRSLLGGQATIGLATSASAAYAGFVTSRAHDLRESSLSVEIAGMVAIASGPQLLVNVYDVLGNRASMVQENGTLSVRLRLQDGPTNTLHSASWNGRLRWRIREAGGQLHFETSVTGTSWTVFHTIATPFDVSLVRVELQAGTYKSVANPGTAKFESVNVGVPSGQFCPTASLVEDFSGAVLSPLLSDRTGGCVSGVSGGAGMIELPTSQAICTLGTPLRYRLTGSSVSAEVVEMVAAVDAARARLRVQTPLGWYAEMQQRNGELRMVVNSGGPQFTSVPYDPVVQRYWRIREEAGSVYWETAPSPGLWTVRRVLAVPPVLDVVQLVFGAEATATFSGSKRFRFDNVNL